MCGIVGYVGRRNSVPILVSGLSRLEYRGYDSAGLTVAGPGRLQVRKLAGRLDHLAGLLARDPVAGSCGIAHTRWATHGAPTANNAHPHVDCTGRIAVVHNGIIENADALRAQLETAGHAFGTETDTEVLAHLIEAAEGSTLESRVASALVRVQGTYGMAVVSADVPDTIVVARRGSPVLLGVGQGEMYVASDASALLEHTRSVVYLDDGDVAVLTPDGYEVRDVDAVVQARDVDAIDWEAGAIELSGHPHFMHKEIFEQPRTVADVMRGRLLPDQGSARLDGLNLSDAFCRDIDRVLILGCGSSWHAGLVGRYYIEDLAGIPVDVEYASEFRYRRPLRMPRTLTVAVSQSGETADTLEALRVAKRAGSRVVGLVNVVGSTIAREADGGTFLRAGPEIGVASTKAFTSQLVALLLLALYLGRQRGLSRENGRRIVAHLAELPGTVERALALDDAVADVAPEFAGRPSALFLGRGLNFPVALEGALKLKEISYVHAEGYPAAEMKHGPIALIDNDMPVVFVAPKDQVYPKIVSNMQEVRARGGRIIALTSEGNGDLRGLATHQLRIPACPPLLAPIVASVPLQLLAYHTAVLRGCDVDRPRNLAKSVTVE
ncbi:MAG TPA: glutamine--fructose-6-phosphate transaminase (isomerizing) [Gemmatimonadaceae bacterium]|nr:glutamine--fructose-6-phosphate transaminase (isomerizing) [Gemmatimonadaceae bacterium]